MMKPFSFIESHARVRALLRRNTRPVSRVSQVGDLMLDREEHRVERNGRRIDLTMREYDLLEFLMRNLGRPVSRANLMEHVWNMPYDSTTNLVDVYAFEIGADEGRIEVRRDYVWMRLNRDPYPTDLLFSICRNIAAETDYLQTSLSSF